MATRFYFGQLITAPALAFSATWSAAGSTPQRARMRTVKRQAALSTAPFVNTSSETTAAILNKLNSQFIVRLGAAQTITGTVKGYALFSESDTAQDCRVQCEIRVIGEDGTVRGTLLAADAGALSSEFVTTPTNRRIPLLAATNTLTSVSAQAGDFLVVEIGHRTHVASGTSYNVTLRWHDDPATGDLPEDETSTSTTLAPWIEFSQNLILSDTLDPLQLSPAGDIGLPGNTANPVDGDPDAPADDLAEFATPQLTYAPANRVAGQASNSLEPTYEARLEVGSAAAAFFPDVPTSADPVTPSMPANVGAPGDSTLPDRSAAPLAEFATPQTISYTLVDPTNRDIAAVLPEIALPGAPPYVANVSPPDLSTIAPTDPLSVDVVAPSGARRFILAVVFPTTDNAPELAHDGDNFRTRYAASTRTPVAGGYRYVLRRSDGWYARPSPLIFAFDVFGQEL